MDRRINTAQGITFNNVSVDDVYYNNEHIWPTGSHTPWSPSSDITTVAWIDASDSSNYTTSGTTLTSVTDKAGTYTMTVGGTPTTGNTQNGLNVFDFNGSNEYLQSTTYSTQVSSGNHWAIGVFRFEGTNSTQDSIWSYETNQSPKRDYAISSGTAETFDRDGSKSSKLHPGFVKSAAVAGRRKSAGVPSTIKENLNNDSSSSDDDIEDPRKALRQLKNLSTRGQAALR